MSIVRVDEFATHLGLASPPPRAQASLDTAEASVAAYLSIESNRRGNPLQEHTVCERITPVRNRTTLEVSGGPVVGIESIAYSVTGYRKTTDEVDDIATTETPTFESVFLPGFSGWTVSGRTDSGGEFEFQRGTEYRVTYRTGWCRGNAAATWEWYRNAANEPFAAEDRLDWGFVDGTATQTIGSDFAFGARPSTNEEGIHYETGSASITDERLLSPAITVLGADFPFVVTRLKLIRASTTGYPCYSVGWQDGDGRTYFTGKKKESREHNFLPDRLRAAALNTDFDGFTVLVADMGYQPASEIEYQMQSPVRSWIDNQITSISLDFWNLGAVETDGALYALDYVTICDGTARMPGRVKQAVMETARAMRDGAGTGIAAESIGDYSRTLGQGEAMQAIPPSARSMLEPYRRPSW